MGMAKHRKAWPRLSLPTRQASVGVADVVAAPPGTERDAMIHNWCVAVWETWQPAREAIVQIARTELGVR
jgi:hypothetical protein